MKKAIILISGMLLHCALFGQSSIVIEELDPGPEFMQLPQITRLISTSNWDGDNFPPEFNIPDGNASYHPFSLIDMINITDSITCEIKGSNITSCNAKTIAETNGTYTDRKGQKNARLKTVQEELIFTYNDAGSYRLLRTNYLFLDAHGNILKAFSETVWQDSETRQYNYYVNNISQSKILESIILRLFPNPTVDELTVEATFTSESPYTIILSDVQGRQIEVLAQGKTTGKTYRNTFNVSGLAAGFYYVTVKTNVTSTVNTFVKN